MESITTLFSIIILIISIIFHELAHGTVADRLGDPTPRSLGRLTLNPFAHLELVGSFLLPLLCIISGSGFIIGWAKPVPFNPGRLKFKRWGPALVALAGPMVNMIIAVACSLVLRFSPAASLGESFTTMLIHVVIINVSLACFNLIPLPPLDGYHIVGAFFPRFLFWAQGILRRYGIVMLVILLLILGPFMGPVIQGIVALLLS